MESLGKILEFVGKYSWAVFVMVAFVLLVPDDGAKQLGLYDAPAATQTPPLVATSKFPTPECEIAA